MLSRELSLHAPESPS